MRARQAARRRTAWLAVVALAIGCGAPAPSAQLDAVATTGVATAESPSAPTPRQTAAASPSTAPPSVPNASPAPSASPSTTPSSVLVASVALRDGRLLLITAGVEGTFPTALVVYDPESGASSAAMPLPHGVGLTATLLADGRVLLAGGRSGQPSSSDPEDPSEDQGSLSRADIFDPASSTITPAGPMTAVRAFHTATRLRDGRVLIVGGKDSDRDGSDLATAEIFDPATGRFRKTGSLHAPRDGLLAVLLANGRVAIVGGTTDGMEHATTVEVYNPSSGRFAVVRLSRSLPWELAAVGLRDGRVLIAGGYEDEHELAEAWVLDPGSGRVRATGSMTRARVYPTAAVLPDGTVLVAGGPSVEVFHPGSGRFSNAGSLVAPRVGANLWVLNSGRVLVVGGGSCSVAAPLAEFYDVGKGTSTGAPLQAPDLRGLLETRGCPVPAPSGTFASVARDSQGFCFIRAEGTLLCWGGFATGWTRVPAPGKFKDVAGPCGLRTDGTLACWPAADDIQVTSEPGATYRSIAGGSEGLCAIRTDGTVQCWGVDPVPDGVFRAISVAGNSACAIRLDGSLVCFGGDVGAVPYAPVMGAYVAIEGNADGGCAVEADATRACWGWGSDDQPEDSCAIRPDGTFTCGGGPWASGFVSVAALDSSTCGVREDGTAVCAP